MSFLDRSYARPKTHHQQDVAKIAARAFSAPDTAQAGLPAMAKLDRRILPALYDKGGRLLAQF